MIHRPKVKGQEEDHEHGDKDVIRREHAAEEVQDQRQRFEEQMEELQKHRHNQVENIAMEDYDLCVAREGGVGLEIRGGKKKKNENKKRKWKKQNEKKKRKMKKTEWEKKKKKVIEKKRASPFMGIMPAASRAVANLSRLA